MTTDDEDRWELPTEPAAQPPVHPATPTAPPPPPTDAGPTDAGPTAPGADDATPNGGHAGGGQAAVRPPGSDLADARPPRDLPPTSLAPRPPATAPDEATVAGFARDAARLAENVALALRGKPEIVRLALVCLFSEGHLLLEDVPGVGKTTLARAIAASLDATWQRIQFTPDLLPSDVTGVSIYNQANQSFEFHPGPVFANVVIGDEINRASPKTQSALLEVMEERQVTVEGRARPVARPFMVIATQNPVEMDGTYRLPEAQLDRFLLRTTIGYPDADAEVDILRGDRRWRTVEELEPVLSSTTVQRMADVAASVYASEGILRYVQALADATRTLDGVRLGVSPRGSLALVRAARTLAATAGRSYVLPEDVKELAAPVLTHRIVVTAEAEVLGHTPATVLDHVLAHVPVPVRRA